MNTRKDLREKLAAMQERAGSARGRRFWRSLEELADSEAFRELMRDEFPEQASVWPDALSRRQFLSLMGASLALAGLSGCSVKPAPHVDLVPYVRQPEEIVPGRPLFYATAMTLGAGIGLLVESHTGRPTKVEGNPDHPAGLGATDVFCQASVLSLYDPDRSQAVTQLGQTRTWDEANAALRSAMRQQVDRRGRGLRLLTETVVSPTLARQFNDLLKKFPEARWHQYEPINGDNAHRAAVLAFGEPVETRYDFTKADVVLTLDADIFLDGPGRLRYTADFMARRRVRTTERDAGRATMSRLYAVEPEVTCTGAKADHRLPLKASEVEWFARALAARLGVTGVGNATLPPVSDRGLNDKWLATVAKDLQAHRGRGVVAAGQRQPPAVHLLAHAINDHLGNVGQTVIYTQPIAAKPVDQTQSLRELVDDMDAGRVDVLIVIGGNPVYTAPADYHFADRLQKVPLRFHLGPYQDETARQCHWHLPETHFLESWSDTRAFDGTASIVQPLIEPLYQGRSPHELLSLLNDHDRQITPPLEIVRGYWRRHWEAGSRERGFEDFWKTAVHDGVVAGTALPPRDVKMRSGWQDHLPSPERERRDTGLEIVFQQDPTVYDGRFANNGWLQELPKPLTKLTWDNAALMSPATAKSLGLGLEGYAHGGEHGGYVVPMVELEVGGRTVRAPVWLMPGHVDGAVTLSLGYGRESAGRVGGDRDHRLGANAYLLRTADHPWFAAGLNVNTTGERYQLACTQQHQLMENREPVRAGTLDKYHHDPRFAGKKLDEEEHEEIQRSRRPLTLYKPYDYSPPLNKWGMAIDLTACVGCNACVVACQAENNIPVVGKDQVLAGREMHWIRIDRYTSGPFDAPEEFHFQPVPCMHCENAPCEYVCPVEATVHSAEGLNEMVYNRCVGTRFCSNNCPYKVRRFNFFSYADYATESVRQQYNPDVTVRSRGVMEKCTYCVQRIRHAEVGAQSAGRPIRDGEVLTACQAACPAGAIVFGDINDPKSTVKRWKDSPLHYALLADLNTEPRTTYLASLRNPNPDRGEW
jgi:MoCo/4Fe-4S cofactor protein with predicted Tat translocation signal